MSLPCAGLLDQRPEDISFADSASKDPRSRQTHARPSERQNHDWPWRGLARAYIWVCLFITCFFGGDPKSKMVQVFFLLAVSTKSMFPKNRSDFCTFLAGVYAVSVCEKNRPKKGYRLPTKADSYVPVQQGTHHKFPCKGKGDYKLVEIALSPNSPEQTIGRSSAPFFRGE